MAYKCSFCEREIHNCVCDYVERSMFDDKEFIPNEWNRKNKIKIRRKKNEIVLFER